MNAHVYATDVARNMSFCFFRVIIKRRDLYVILGSRINWLPLSTGIPGTLSVPAKPRAATLRNRINKMRRKHNQISRKFLIQFRNVNKIFKVTK